VAVVWLEGRSFGRLELADYPDELVEGLVDIHPLLGAALDVRDFELTRGVLGVLQ